MTHGVAAMTPPAPPVRAAEATVANSSTIVDEREEHGNVGARTAVAAKMRRTFRIEDGESVAAASQKNSVANSESPILEACGSVGSSLSEFGLNVGRRRRRISRALIVDDSSDDGNNVTSAASTALPIARVVKKYCAIRVMLSGQTLRTIRLQADEKNTVEKRPAGTIQPTEGAHTTTATLVHDGLVGVADGSCSVQPVLAQHENQESAEEEDSATEREDEDSATEIEDDAPASGAPALPVLAIGEWALDDAHGAGNNRGPRFVCTHPGCDYVTNRRVHFTAHLNVHDGIRPFACSQGCGYRAKQRGAVVTHERTQGGCEHYTCTTCNRFVTSEKSRLVEHQANHLLAKEFACSKCGYTTRSKGSMKKHLKEVHEHLKKFVCHHCGKDFRFEGHLKGHLLREHHEYL